jgi:hypothetical protein
MGVVLIVSFIIVVILTNAKTSQSSKSPDFSLCQSEIPALFLGGYENVTAGLTFEVPSPFACSSCAVDCSNLWTQSAYAVYSYKGDALQPAVPYSLSACQASACPSVLASSQCPCVDPYGSSTCSTLACTRPTPGHTCETFKAGAIAACYCLQLMTLTTEKSGWFTAILSLFQDDICSGFAQSVALQLVLQLVLSFSTVGVNAFLTVSTNVLTDFERNSSSDTEASQLITKVFWAQYINTALLLLLVYGRLEDSGPLAEAVRGAGILSGKYSDFSVDWYATVGVQLTLTALISAITPHVQPLLQYFVIFPLQRFLARRPGAILKGGYPMQKDLNAIYTGPRFDVTNRYPAILVMLFFSMTYSSGLPVMLVFALMAFSLSYVVDRYLLLRFYKRPPQRDERLQRKVVDFLPYALLLHLSFAVWMFGNPQILGRSAESALLASSVEGTASGVASSAYVAEKIGRRNVLPLFLMWVGVLCYVVAVDVLPSQYLSVVIGWITEFVQHVRKIKVAHDLGPRAEPGYTKVYERPLPTNFKSDDLGKKYAGWDVFQNDDGSSVLRKLRSPTAASPSSANRPVEKAAGGRVSCRRTWEVIRVYALHTYALSRNPKYKEAVSIFMKEFGHEAEQAPDPEQGGAPVE